MRLGNSIYPDHRICSSQKPSKFAPGSPQESSQALRRLDAKPSVAFMPSSPSPSCQALRRPCAAEARLTATKQTQLLSVAKQPSSPSALCRRKQRLTATKQTQLLFSRKATKLSVGPVPAEATTDSYQANSTTPQSRSNQALRRPCAGGSTTDSYQANSTTPQSRSNQALRRPCAGGSND